MDLTISASPTAEIVLSRYDAARFQKFRPLFEPIAADSPLRFFAQQSEHADRAVVMENKSDRDVTALRYRWFLTREDGTAPTHTLSSDSYYSGVYHPVLKSHDRLLICGSVTVGESFLEHVLGGGGFAGGSAGANRDMVGVIALRFEIDMLLFRDGELCGRDSGNFVTEIRCRRPAAEFVAKQIRLAEAENRDVAPVLSALAQVPHERSDFLAYWTQHFAGECLRNIHHQQIWKPLLQHLENFPTLPELYRLDGASSIS